MRPILRDEDNIRYADNVLDLVKKISPHLVSCVLCVLQLIFNL